jgi:cobalt-precorrin-7 (C5)-methyltransferase
MAMNRIALVGCGPGAWRCVTEEARLAVCEADALVGTGRLFDLFPEARARRVVVSGHLREAIEAVEQNRAGKVAVLVTGDPGVASLAQGMLEHFGRENCRVIAGLSSVQTAFARLGMSWQDARIVNAHSAEPQISYGRLAEEKQIAVLAGSARTAAWIAGLGKALGERWRIHRLHDLTLPTEEAEEIGYAELGAERLQGRTILVFARREQE